MAWKHSVFCNFKICWQRQTIFTPVDLELEEEDKEEEKEEKEEAEDEDEDDDSKESFRHVMQLISCGKYKEVILLAYCLWEKRKDNKNPEERRYKARESAI